MQPLREKRASTSRARMSVRPISIPTPALKPSSQPGSYFVVASCQVMVVVFKPAFTLNESCAEAVVPIAIMATRAKSSVAFFITYRFNEVCSVSKMLFNFEHWCFTKRAPQLPSPLNHRLRSPPLTALATNWLLKAIEKVDGFAIDNETLVGCILVFLADAKGRQRG